MSQVKLASTLWLGWRAKQFGSSEERLVADVPGPLREHASERDPE
jgi:hypothetical protein